MNTCCRIPDSARSKLDRTLLIRHCRIRSKNVRNWSKGADHQNGSRIVRIRGLGGGAERLLRGRRWHAEIAWPLQRSGTNSVCLMIARHCAGFTGEAELG